MPAFAFATWPRLGITLVNAIHLLDETVPWRQPFFDMSWRRWEFWLFSAVLIWALIANQGDLLSRMCPRRQAEDWGDGPANIGTACLFTSAHAEYQIL